MFTLVLLEATMRLFFVLAGKDIDTYRHFSFTRTAHNIENDPELGYRLVPNVSRNALTSDFAVTYTTNSLGLRDHEIEPTDDFKILVIGDSQTFGEGVAAEHRYTEVIEERLDGVVVINAAIPGYGIHQMEQWLHKVGTGLEPDLVICSLIRVDLDRVMYKRWFPISEDNGDDGDDEPTQVEPPPTLRTRLRTLVNRSYTYSFGKVQWKIIQVRGELRERDRKVWEEIDKSGMHDGFSNSTEGQKRFIDEESLAALRGMKSTAAELGVPLLVVNIDDHPLPWLSATLASEEIEYLDLAAPIAETFGLRFEIDRHYTEIGHGKIADSLLAFIQTRFGPLLARHAEP